MRILVFSGTSDGRTLSAALAALGGEVTVSVATDYGREEQAQTPGTEILEGQLTAGEMVTLLKSFDLCVDATHPYAKEASGNIAAACRAAGVPLRRLVRPALPLPDGAVTVADAPAAAAFLAGQKGNILLTTGAKELPAFGALEKARLFPRVLPSHAALDACEALGVPHRNIIAMQGPFSRALNEATLRQYRIEWLVTKEGGSAGGFAEKAEAAAALGVGLVVLTRPAESGCTAEEILAECRIKLT